MSYGREDVRLDLDMHVTITTVFNDDGVMIPAMQEIKMLLTNLSATGIMLESDRDFKERSSFMLELELGDEKINLMPVIVRKIKDGKTFKYGCKLMHLDPHEEQIIRNFIFKTQLNKRRFHK